MHFIIIFIIVVVDPLSSVPCHSYDTCHSPRVVRPHNMSLLLTPPRSQRRVYHRRYVALSNQSTLKSASNASMWFAVVSPRIVLYFTNSVVLLFFLWCIVVREILAMRRRPPSLEMRFASTALMCGRPLKSSLPSLLVENDSRSTDDSSWWRRVMSCPAACNLGSSHFPACDRASCEEILKDVGLSLVSCRLCDVRTVLSSLSWTRLSSWSCFAVTTLTCARRFKALRREVLVVRPLVKRRLFVPCKLAQHGSKTGRV